MFKPLVAIFLLFILVIIGYQFYGTFKNYRDLKGQFAEIETAAAVLEEEHQKMQKEIRYFSKVENLIKELRSRFNYRFPGERLIIIAPEGSVAEENNQLQNIND